MARWHHDLGSARAILAQLLPRLEVRRLWHGHANVTYAESRYLVRHELYQPGHAWIRYSTPSEDLSDATQARLVAMDTGTPTA